MGSGNGYGGAAGSRRPLPVATAGALARVKRHDSAAPPRLCEHCFLKSREADDGCPRARREESADVGRFGGRFPRRSVGSQFDQADLRAIFRPDRRVRLTSSCRICSLPTHPASCVRWPEFDRHHPMTLHRCTTFVCHVLFAAFLTSVVAGQPANSGSIVGRVSNQRNGEYLENVRISVEGTTQEVFTDVDGYYRLTNVPPGTAHVRA